MRTTICFDFDGVLHSYKSGWTGIDNVSDDPVWGAVEACKQLEKAGYELVILSTRFCSEEPAEANVVYDNHDEVVMDPYRGKKAVEEWLKKHGFPEMKLCETKPPASLYVDDRGFRFNGDFKALLNFIKKNPQLGSWVARPKDKKGWVITKEDTAKVAKSV